MTGKPVENLLLTVFYIQKHEFDKKSIPASFTGDAFLYLFSMIDLIFSIRCRNTDSAFPMISFLRPSALKHPHPSC